MNNNKTIFRAILCIAIIAAFFLPWFKFGGGSGLDIVTNKNAEETTATMIIRYSFLLIPFFALIVLIRSISNKPSIFLFRLLPFLVTAILTALFIIGMSDNGASGEELRAWMQILDYGFYITVVASLLLLFI